MGTTFGEIEGLFPILPIDKLTQICIKTLKDNAKYLFWNFS